MTAQQTWPCVHSGQVHTDGPCIHEDGCRCGEFGRPSALRCTHHRDLRRLS